MPVPKRKLEINAEFPEALGFLFEPARYKVCWGGRGAGRSWGYARALLILAIQKKLRILCARELQKSISDSVHALLSDQIRLLGLQSHYQVLKASITSNNGSEFIFAGLKSNIDAIKSAENIDICWVEEADSVSRGSWETLVPTIRAENSEIWVTFNPSLESDDTYKRFILHPPPNAVVKKISWRDNPWFPKVLDDERRFLKTSDINAYRHVWEGECLSTVEGAIYAAELSACEAAGHITHIAYDPSKPVYTFWDLGYGDNTAIWFCQVYPWEYRCIDYMEGSQLPLAHYLRELQRRPYVYSVHSLPHDAQAHSLGTGKSVQELMVAAGFKTRIVPKLSIHDGINAARTLFPLVWFDVEKCADGLQALRHYRWAPVNTSGIVKREPLHDWASNGADGFRYLAVGVKPSQASKPIPEYRQYQPVSAWS